MAKDPACDPEVRLYTVWPGDGENKADCAQVAPVLRAFAGEAADIYVSQNDKIGLNFWRLNLTSDQAMAVTSLPGVRAFLWSCPFPVSESSSGRR